jgi:hypothetical protein
VPAGERGFFSPGDAEPARDGIAGERQRNAAERLDYRDAFAQLVAHGHSHEAILGYTLAQFRGYLERSFKRDRRERRERTEDMAYACAGGEALTTRLKQLAD